MEEIWKDISGYEGLYQISNFGRVKSIERYVPTIFEGRKTKCKKYELIRKHHINGYGYPSVFLFKNGVRKGLLIHRLIANAFIPKIEGKNLINHIDSNTRNYAISNLEWCTHTENIRHGYTSGHNKYYGENHPNSKLDLVAVQIIREMCRAKIFSQRKIAKYFNISPTTIAKIHHNRIWAH